MTPKRLDLHDIRDIRFEGKDADIFNIPDTKTRLDTLQNYFFPRLEVLLRDTVELIQEVLGVNPYERMTVTARPRHRQKAQRFLDSGIVYMGLTGQRRTNRPLVVHRPDGRLFSYPPSRLTYIVYPEGELQVMFHPFTHDVDARFQARVAAPPPRALDDPGPGPGRLLCGAHVCRGRGVRGTLRGVRPRCHHDGHAVLPSGPGDLTPPFSARCAHVSLAARGVSRPVPPAGSLHRDGKGVPPWLSHRHI